MNQMKCPRLIRGTVYILIMEGEAGNMSSNLGFGEHSAILKRKLFALFSSSCLASVTHEALTLPGKRNTAHLQYTIPWHLEGTRPGLVIWEQESTRLCLLISSPHGLRV